MPKAPQLTAQRLDTLLSYLQKDPENARLRVEVFETALAIGAFNEAEAQVVYAKRFSPEDIPWREREVLLLLAQGHYQGAQQSLEWLINEGQSNPANRYNLAYAYFGQGKMREARDGAAALLTDPNEVGGLAWTLWLRCKHHLAELDEGLAAFAAASGISMSAETWGVASLMAFDAERLKEAEEWSERALMENPIEIEALVARGSLALGKQEDKEAQQLFERAIKIRESDGRCWSGLAFTRMYQMNMPGARVAFKKAVATMPNHIGTWIGLGWCEFLTGHTGLARTAFERALDLDRNFAESHGSLAVTLAAMGLKGSAKTEIDIALKLDSRCLSARYAQALLSGEVNDPAAFSKLSRRVLAQHPLTGAGPAGSTLADVVLRRND